MNILFATIVWPEGDESNIYTDLMQEFANQGHNVYVLCSRERRMGKSTEYRERNGIHVLRVRCGNIQKTNFIEKGISVVLLGNQMMQALKRHLSSVKFNIIICSTPPITLAGMVATLKKKHKAKVYLLLKDMWPQGPVDMGAIKKGGLTWQYFRRKEKRMYAVADYIGCMSPAGVRYVLKHNPQIPPNRVEECPNSIRLRKLSPVERDGLRQKYRIPKNATVFVFGGNLGMPQGLHFLVNVIKMINGDDKVYFLIIGSGTHYPMLKKAFKEIKPTNAAIYERLPKVDYDQLVRACDVGLILLDKRYSIPHFPSRLLSYLEAGMPVLCAVNEATDIGTIVEQAGSGITTMHGDIESFASAARFMAERPERKFTMGLNARKLLENRYSTSRSYKIIMNHFRREFGDALDEETIYNGLTKDKI
jgi:glycosyltransferase involved in cell wall biosynthesis